MNFAVAAGCHSSRAAPFLRDTPAATYYTTTRQRLHLSTAKRCADKASHLMEAGMPLQPCLDLGMLMGCVVVGDQVHIEELGRLGIDPTQELEPFLVPMAR